MKYKILRKRPSIPYMDPGTRPWPNVSLAMYMPMCLLLEISARSFHTQMIEFAAKL